MLDAVLSAQPVLLTSWRDSKPQQGQKISAEGEKVRELGEMGCVGGGESKSNVGRVGTSLHLPLQNVLPGTPRYHNITKSPKDKMWCYIGTMSKQGNPMALFCKRHYDEAFATPFTSVCEIFLCETGCLMRKNV